MIGTRLVNRLRFRLARCIAPAPIVAAPLGDGPALILLRGEQSDYFAWIAVRSIDISIKAELRPLADDFLTTWLPSNAERGTFSGTI